MTKSSSADVAPAEWHRHSRELRRHLERDLGVSPRVAEGFEAIPRHAFVPSFFDDRSTISVDPSDGASLARVYADQALTTALDERGRPRSSSTAPWLMALMLEALDLQPGQRVLEIGTGTGYNAAHLARLVGPDGFVDTVEIDPDLARAARTRLLNTGHRNVAVHAANALSVDLPRNDYDRILVTAGFWQPPFSWWRALRPNGLLVGSLGRALVGPIAIMTKQDRDRGTGRFLPGPNIGFTPLTDTPTTIVPSGLAYRAAGGPMVIPRDTHFDPTLLSSDHVGFLFMLQLALPQAELRRYPAESVTELRDDATGDIARFGNEAPSGSPGLLARLEELQRTWVELGRPEPTEFRISVDSNGGLRLAVGAEEGIGPVWTIPPMAPRDRDGPS